MKQEIEECKHDWKVCKINGDPLFELHEDGWKNRFLCTKCGKIKFGYYLDENLNAEELLWSDL